MRARPSSSGKLASKVRERTSPTPGIDCSSSSLARQIGEASILVADFLIDLGDLVLKPGNMALEAFAQADLLDGLPSRAVSALRMAMSCRRLTTRA